LARATVLEHWGAQRGFNLSSKCAAGNQKLYQVRVRTECPRPELAYLILTLLAQEMNSIMRRAKREV
jgi:hypothetical protein